MRPGYPGQATVHYLSSHWLGCDFGGEVVAVSFSRLVLGESREAILEEDVKIEYIMLCNRQTKGTKLNATPFCYYAVNLWDP